MAIVLIVAFMGAIMFIFTTLTVVFCLRALYLFKKGIDPILALRANRKKREFMNQGESSYKASFTKA